MRIVATRDHRLYAMRHRYMPVLFDDATHVRARANLPSTDARAVDDAEHAVHVGS